LDCFLNSKDKSYTVTTNTVTHVRNSIQGYISGMCHSESTITRGNLIDHAAEIICIFVNYMLNPINYLIFGNLNNKSDPKHF
jgi:hypothetical protein